jgi:hypothetical protein
MTDKNKSPRNHELWLLIIITILSSCESFLEIGNPSNQLITKTVFESDLTATAAIDNIYTKLSSSSGSLNSITYLGPLLADEATLYSTDQATIELFTNNITTSNSLASTFWGTSGYSLIYQANAAVEGLQRTTSITPSLRKQLMGEALFIRVFLHFYLLNLFGDIPYITSTDYQKNTFSQRMHGDLVYQQMILDLAAARDSLSEDYTYSNTERIRPNKWSASALLARIYLYNENWPLAISESTQIINQVTKYSLAPIDKVFLKNSEESIWQLKPGGTNKNTNEGNIFILTGQPKLSSLRNEFVISFEPGDLRKSHWVNSITTGSATWYYPFKYKIRTGSTPLNEYSMVLRLAEQYLIRAEAKVHQSDLSGAISDVDAIRQRAGLAKIQDTNPSIGSANLLLAIEQERRAELFTEWGHRWFDLKRTNRLDTIMSAIKSGWTATDQLFPIPASEILVNYNLTQNPGY